MQRLSFIIVLIVLSGHLHAQNPHGVNLVLDCEDCHTSGSWLMNTDSAVFSHDNTNFALEGRHSSVSCKDCHTSLVFEDASDDCVSCHTDVHSMSVGNDCVRCHNSTNWLVDNIPDLHEQNGFPLLGQHRMASCTDCHISENDLIWNRIGSDCASCHLPDFDATSDPNHQAAGFSTNCIECHDILAQDWTTSEFHVFFPLEGNHDIQDCSACHMDNNYSTTSSECVSCHMDDFNATTEPDHQAAGFSTNCIECHDPMGDGWGTDGFHLFFPLEGNHDVQDCNACHDGNNYSAASSECVSCHLEDFNATTEPDHQAAGFSTNCIECHDPMGDGWGADGFHLTFPLEGNHNIQDCNACHDGNNYSAASSECVSCHLDDFNATTEPDHQAAGFSTNCIECHDPMGDGWGSDNFHLTFPLTGGHEIQDCNACHEGNNYSDASPECISCHLDDFQATTSPNHVSSGLSTNCIECHTIDNWDSGIFDQHDAIFPIFSGDHNNEWDTCDECHTTPGNYNLFSCIECHEHDNPNDLADEHDEVDDYVYESNACYFCHPDGSE